MPPFVSVIVPVLNNQTGIRALLAALARQTYDHERFEVIVADNGSSDLTPEVVEHARPALAPTELTLVFETEARGSYAARNKGFEAARGEIITFTDSDCLPAPEWIARGVAALLNEPCDLAAGRVDMTFRPGGPNVWEYIDASRKLNQKLYVEDAGFGATANLFVRRSAMDRGGAFRGELASGGDYEFGRRLTARGAKLIYAHHAVVAHPARATFREILHKTKRLAIGQKQLDGLGSQDHGRVTSRSFLPVLLLPAIEGTESPLTLRVAGAVLSNVFRLAGLYWRRT
jgi:glycosyltransferase involved in cell wall biosynthesis